MAESHTQQLSLLIERLRDGDGTAREELIRVALDRLERLTRKMLRGFPRVRRWEETGDVLQNALLRLDRALRSVAPDSTRAFFGLAAEQIRRELLDLTRHYQGPNGPGRNLVRAGDVAGDDRSATPEPVDAGLDRWTEFHRAVEHLPAEDREVFMLTFYHGWTQLQIAELFAVDERTVRRRWRSASAMTSPHSKTRPSDLGSETPVSNTIRDLDPLDALHGTWHEARAGDGN